MSPLYGAVILFVLQKRTLPAIIISVTSKHIFNTLQLLNSQLGELAYNYSTRRFLLFQFIFSKSVFLLYDYSTRPRSAGNFYLIIEREPTIANLDLRMYQRKSGMPYLRKEKFLNLNAQNIFSKALNIIYYIQNITNLKISAWY